MVIAAALAVLSAACTPSSTAKPPPPPTLHAEAAAGPTATGKAQSAEATVSAWTQPQIDAITVQCLQAVPGDSSPQRQPFCQCLAQAASSSFPYQAYQAAKDDVYQQIVRKAGDQCAQQSGDAQPGVVDDGTNQHHWTANDIAQATGRCTSDLPQIGLGLDPQVVSATCSCLLKTPMQNQSYADFAAGLTKFVATELSNGGLKACLAQVGFSADAVKARKWSTPRAGRLL